MPKEKLQNFYQKTELLDPEPDIFFSVLLTSTSPFAYPSCRIRKDKFPPFPVLKSIVFPPNYSFCPFSSTHSSCLHLPL
jgi:hypothetical protein